jgi:Protein of unknown function (DUF2971)
MENLPSHFYRYRSLMGDSAEYVRLTLLDNQLYFANPSSFNDPFDCYPSFDFDATKTEIINFFARIFRRKFPLATEERILRYAIAKLYDPKTGPMSPDYTKQVSEAHNRHVAEKIGVACLSEIPDDILMWSHYADFHRGVCLQFDSNLEFFANAHQINYKPERPKVNPFRDENKKIMNSVLLTKANHWEYEKEWRLIHYEGGAGVYRFPSEALTGLVLGSRISKSNEQKVLAWLADREKPIKVMRSSTSQTAYSLTIS